MDFNWIKDAAAQVKQAAEQVASQVGTVLRGVADIPREAADRINQVHVDNQERIKKVSKAVRSAVSSAGEQLGQAAMNSFATEYPQVGLSNRRTEDGKWIPGRDEDDEEHSLYHYAGLGSGVLAAGDAALYAVTNPGKALQSGLGALALNGIADGFLTDDYGTYGNTIVRKNDGYYEVRPNKTRGERRAEFFAPKGDGGAVDEHDLLSPYNPAVFLSDPARIAGAAVGPLAFGWLMPALLDKTVAGRGVDLYWRAMAPKYTYDAGRDLVNDIKEDNWGDAAGDAFWTVLNATMLPGTVQLGVKGAKGAVNGAKTLKNLPKGTRTGYLKDQAKNAVDAATKDTWTRNFVEDASKAWK